MGAICLRQLDAKVLIAYSSVAHIRLVICAALTHSLVGLCGAFLLVLAHGVSSSGIFCAANIIYESANTRNLLINKRGLVVLPAFALG